MKTATLRRPVRTPSVPRARDRKAVLSSSQYVLEATRHGFPPPYEFSRFAGWLFAWRARQYSEEWWTERSASEGVRAHPQDRVPIGGPGDAWGEQHLRQQGHHWLALLKEAWEQLGTEDHRARALVVLSHASSEARQRKSRGDGYWKKKRVDRRRKQRMLHETRVDVEKRGPAFISALEAYLAATKALAPYASTQLAFSYSAEGLEQAVMAEYENPGEIAACLTHIRAVLDRLRAIQDYEAAPKGPGRRGPEESKATNTAIRELDRMFQQNVPTLYQAEQYTHGLLYVAGIWPRPEQHSMTGTLHRLRATRP